MTTAEIGIIATGSVGALGIIIPFLTRRADRGHERDLARAARLYAQRHGAYLELVRFLERERLILHRTERLWESDSLPAPPDPLDDEAWLNMRTQWVTFASEDVRAALVVAGERFRTFSDAVVNLRVAVAQGPVFQGSLQEIRTKVDDTRLDADAAFDAAEHAMNVELAAL